MRQLAQHPDITGSLAAAQSPVNPSCGTPSACACECGLGAQTPRVQRGRAESAPTTDCGLTMQPDSGTRPCAAKRPRAGSSPSSTSSPHRHSPPVKRSLLHSGSPTTLPAPVLPVSPPLSVGPLLSTSTPLENWWLQTQDDPEAYRVSMASSVLPVAATTTASSPVFGDPTAPWRTPFLSKVEVKSEKLERVVDVDLCEDSRWAAEGDSDVYGQPTGHRVLRLRGGGATATPTAGCDDINTCANPHLVPAPPTYEGPANLADVCRREYKPRHAVRAFCNASNRGNQLEPGAPAPDFTNPRVVDAAFGPMPTVRTMADAVQRFNKVMDPLAPRRMCACCGVVSPGAATFHIHVDSPLLDVLHVSAENLAAIDTVPIQYREAFTVLRPEVTTSPSSAHRPPCPMHLHSNAVDEQGRASLCISCHTTLHNGEMPAVCLASGFDFGRIPPGLDLPHPTIVEQQLISVSRLYFGTLKVSAKGDVKAFGYTKINAHSITFAQHSLDELDNHLAGTATVGGTGPHAGLLLPRLEISPAAFCVSFVGSRGQWDNLGRRLNADGSPCLRQCLIPVVEVRPWVVFGWLKLLKAVNPLYAGVVLRDEMECTAALLRVPDALLDNPMCLASIAAATADVGVGSDVADARRTEARPRPTVPSPPAPGEATIPSGSSPSTPAGDSSLSEGGEPTTYSVFRLTLDATLQPTDEVPGDSSESALRSLLEMLRKPGGRGVVVHTSPEPINEFTDNEHLFMSTFPTLFILGRKLPSASGVPSLVFTEYLLAHGATPFAQDTRLIFNLFSQYRRHTAAAAVALKLKVASGPQQAAALRTINSADFYDELAFSAANPKSPRATALLRTLLPMVQLCGRAVPFSAEARRQCLTQMYALTQRFGLPRYVAALQLEWYFEVAILYRASDILPQCPVAHVRVCYHLDSLFVTFAPTDVDSALLIRLSGKPDDPNTPDSGVAATFSLPPLSERQRIAFANPAAASTFYATICDAVFSELFGLPDTNSTRVTATLPLSDRRPGIFGVPVAFFSVTEEVLSVLKVSFSWPTLS